MNLIVNVYTFGVLMLAIFAGIYVKWPPPTLSRRLIAWKDSGKYHQFQNYHHIFYKDDIGQGPENEVLLLIHGFPTSSYDWNKIYNKLKSRFGRLIAPDMLGYGFSSKPVYQYIVKMEPSVQMVEVEHNYTIGEQADIIDDLLKFLNISSVNLLAHDYGDTVAQELVRRHTTIKQTNESIEIKTLCMLNGGIFSDIYTPRLIQKLMLKPYLKDILPKLINYWFFSKRLLGYIPERKLLGSQWIAAVQRTTARVHFIYGPDDPVNPAPFEQRFRQTFTNATIDVLENIGHYVQQEAPTQLLSSYFTFLDKA